MRRVKPSTATFWGFTLQGEFYRQERDSWKGDLALNGEYVIELFSFPFPPARPSRPEACGCAIWRLALMMSMLPLRILRPTAWACEGVRIDPFTGKRFTFFNDPDGLPLEIYQQ